MRISVVGRQRRRRQQDARARARSCRRRPSPAAGRAGSRPRCRASSCRCRSCSRRSRRAALTTSASSGSGTFHASRGGCAPSRRWPTHAVRRRLEEQLRPLRLVDAVVEIAARGVLRLLHPRVAAALVRHARGPDFLRADGRQQRVDGAAVVPAARRGPPTALHERRPDRRREDAVPLERQRPGALGLLGHDSSARSEDLHGASVPHCAGGRPSRNGATAFK